LVRCKTYDVLIDCGEGTQRQLKIKKISPTRIRKILISHWHGDHTLGIAGLIQTLGMSNYEGVLEIYGPKGTKKSIKALHDAFYFEERIQLKVIECKEGKIFEDENLKIECAELEHNVPCLGFSITEQDKRRMNLPFVKKLGIPDGPLLGKLQQGKSIVWKGKKILPGEATYIVKGKKMAYIVDTLLCDNCFRLAKDADLLVCEATFKSELEEKGADSKHMTAKQAAQIANQANVEKLVLTHFSQRYKSVIELEDDAKDLFHNTISAHDFMQIKI
jgi:ribonuclease Z